MGGARDLIKYYQSPNPIHCYLNNTWVRKLNIEELDTVINVEDVNGTNYSDVIVGDDYDNIIHGLSGGDTLIGLRGNDILNGNDGNDWVDYYECPKPININLSNNITTIAFYSETD